MLMLLCGNSTMEYGGQPGFPATTVDGSTYPLQAAAAPEVQAGHHAYQGAVEALAYDANAPYIANDQALAQALAYEATADTTAAQYGLAAPYAAPAMQHAGGLAPQQTPYSAGAPLQGFANPSPAAPSQGPLVLIPLCRKGDRAGIERHLQAGASVHETDIEGNTPLHVAVEAPRNEIATVQCILEAGADANALNYIGATPLHYVCLRKSNYRGVANILLENGAQINRQTVAGKAALHFACENQLPELVEVLCLFGADTNLADVEANTPVHLTLLREGGRDTQKREILEHLVAYNACCAYSNSEGLTPVHLACQSGYVRCLQYLLDRGAELPAVTLRGQNGLHLACLYGHAQIAQLIVSVYPSIVDSVDLEGNTPLHCCGMVGNLDCALILLKSDANTTLRNAAKKTAFELARVRGTDINNTHNPELVQVLKDAQKGGSCR